MAKVLGIDTAGKGLSLAVAEGDKLLASACLNVGLTHSQRLLPLLAALLEGAALRPADIDLIAVTNGPGSFTGLRIGLATAKGLAAGLGCKLLPVSTLEAAAYAVRGMGAYICPVLDARRNEVYTALYTPEGAELWPPVALAPEKLAEQLREFLAANQPQRVMFVGDAAELYIEKFLAALPPERAEAFYLRLSEAERNRNARLAAEARQ